MQRRTFVKTTPTLPALTGAMFAQESAAGGPSMQASAAGNSSKAKSGTVPAYAGKLGISDMAAIDADGNPQPGFADKSSKARSDDPKAPYEMPLTKEEQAIMNGEKGPELAKVMKIVVAHGNAFGAEKLVDLGGAPHCSLYTGTDYMEPMINLFQQCADAGLKAYAPYTVNPRCYDLYNVNNNPTDIELIYEGYRLQRDLDRVHALLGAPDLNYRRCACYVDEVGNAPPPGTYVAWAESSAINYGNSVLGVRTNRNAGGMELLCALLGKAPLFGLMTDEGRMANWLVEVKTSEEPDWGVVGTAIGLKVIDGVPFITGLAKYLGGKVTNDNMHLLKKMGSATAASGAVGLYHVENVTPDAKAKGRELLKEGYQTYVIDDAEQARVLSNFPTEKEGRPEKPTVCLIGCPHNTYHEIKWWGKKVTEALSKRGLKQTAIPVKLFCSHVVRDHLVEDEPVLVSEMKKAGMNFTNMCTVSYAGMKGFSERTFGVTNSPKTRNYYPEVRYLTDSALLETICTGDIPQQA
ncbi:MAG: aconitase X [Planctomycetota bacterium]